MEGAVGIDVAWRRLLGNGRTTCCDGLERSRQSRSYRCVMIEKKKEVKEEATALKTSIRWSKPGLPAFLCAERRQPHLPRRRPWSDVPDPSWASSKPGGPHERSQSAPPHVQRYGSEPAQLVLKFASSATIAPKGRLIVHRMRTSSGSTRGWC